MKNYRKGAKSQRFCHPRREGIGGKPAKPEAVLPQSRKKSFLSRPEIGLHKTPKIMEEKSKFILGLVPSQTDVDSRFYFSKEMKHHIIQDYLSSSCTKREIWEKYTGQTRDHGSLLRWMRGYGYLDKRGNFASKFDEMKDRTQLPEPYENLQLKKRIEELEKQLKNAEMKAIAFSTMIDIAEKEFKIPIRKKFNTQPSKK